MPALLQHRHSSGRSVKVNEVTPCSRSSEFRCALIVWACRYGRMYVCECICTRVRVFIRGYVPNVRTWRGKTAPTWKKPRAGGPGHCFSIPPPSSPPAPLAFPLVPFIRALGLPALRRIRAKEGNKASVRIRRDCLENLGILPALSPLLTPCRVGGEGGEGGGEGETVPVSAHGKFRYEANISTLASP